MTNADRVLQYLTSVSPAAVTNSDIRSETGIGPHQQVYQITQLMLLKGEITGRQRGHIWEFWVENDA